MDSEVKRRLVFHFYVPENWKDIHVFKMHLNALKYYSKVFTESLFVISVDDVNNKELINEFEDKLIDNGYIKNVTFKVVKNTLLYETKTLQEEIVSKLKDLDGLTFFGHSKGIGNEIFESCPMEELEWWISGLYYLSLDDIYNMECSLLGVWGITYGPFKDMYEEVDNKYHWFYSGTFYWINCQRLYDKIKRENLELRHPSDRFFSELWLGDIIEKPKGVDFPNKASSRGESYLMNANNFYDHVSEYVKLILNEDKVNELKEFKEKISTEEL